MLPVIVLEEKSLSPKNGGKFSTKCCLQIIEDSKWLPFIWKLMNVFEKYSFELNYGQEKKKKKGI